MEILVKNQSTVVSDADVQAWVAAQQVQFSRDFGPAWHIDATIHFVTKSQKVSSTQALLVIIDTADEAGALGYHFKSSAGTPLGKVFAKTTMDDGASWTVCASHEALELAADPWINGTVLDEATMKLYALEISDAVEDDSLGYKINGVLLSDFVFPSYFESDITLSKTHKRSFCGHVTRPFEIPVGGYMSMFDINNPSAGWQQLDKRLRVRPGSRRARRENPGERLESTAE